jgi:hypothetical protein
VPVWKLWRGENRLTLPAIKPTAHDYTDWATADSIQYWLLRMLGALSPRNKRLHVLVVS